MRTSLLLSQVIVYIELHTEGYGIPWFNITTYLPSQDATNPTGSNRNFIWSPGDSPAGNTVYTKPLKNLTMDALTNAKVMTLARPQVWGSVCGASVGQCVGA